MYLVVLTSNWAKISRKIIRNGEEISDSYQSSKAESSNISNAVELTWYYTFPIIDI